MKKLTEEKKQGLIKLMVENNNQVQKAIKMISDFGKYKERKKYIISDVEYQEKINSITLEICRIYHSFNVANEMMKLYGEEDNFKNVMADINSMVLAEIKAEEEKAQIKYANEVTSKEIRKRSIDETEIDLEKISKNNGTLN